jgi:uncharacterized protein YaiI (UPF0178 family)
MVAISDWTKGKAAVPEIYVDADACPVKEEICRVARRHGLNVILVTNTPMRIPDHDSVRLVVVDDGFDAADDWIADHVGDRDIVVTADIPLASRCLKRGARVLGLKGHPFTDRSIGNAMATREIMSHLRECGTMTGGPAPFAPKDRSRFLQSLEEMVQACLRDPPKASSSE